jgi:nucleotide-binding universal stress UspA family protein
VSSEFARQRIEDSLAISIRCKESGHEFWKILTGVDPSVVVYAPQAGMPPGELVTLSQQDGKRLFAAFAQCASLQPQPLQLVHGGKSATEIVQAAKDGPADLIDVGSQGRRGVNCLLLESVAEEVMRHAACPVLLVGQKHE